MVFAICMCALMVLPLVISARSGRVGTLDDLLTNAGRNTLGRTVAGVVCGNVGVGSFVAIYLFAGASPVIGASVAAAYTLGLVVCAILAPRIRARAAGTVSLVSLLARHHGLASPLPLWVPVAAIFLLRASVQLTALALLVQGATGIAMTPALIGSGVAVALYTAIGGYRAAVETDVAQAIVIVGLMTPIWLNLPAAPVNGAAFLELGPYGPALLIAIWIFVPFSAVLAVDNWQRITLAEDQATARAAFLIATPVCGAIFATIAWIGHALPGGDVFDTFRSLMPVAAPWLADLLFITAIMSSIDTFVMPLVLGAGRKRPTLGRLRAMIAGLFAVIIAVSVIFGALLTSVIAAFSSLSVFLPAVFGTLFLAPRPARAAVVSMNGGVVVAMVLTVVSRDLAALGGFAVAALSYASLRGKS